MATVNLFAELTANGNSAALALPGPVCDVDVYLKEGANDGGGTLKLQVSQDGTVFADVTSASWTSGDGLLGRYTVYGGEVRFNLAGATGPSNMIPQVVARPRSMAQFRRGELTANGSATVTLGHVPAAVTLWGLGTWGSGTMKLEMSADGGTTWYDTGASLTANGYSTITNTGENTLFRVTLSGATSPVLDWFVLAD